jgi:hypothetical protein
MPSAHDPMRTCSALSGRTSCPVEKRPVRSMLLTVIPPIFILACSID